MLTFGLKHLVLELNDLSSFHDGFPDVLAEVIILLLEVIIR